MGDVTESPFEQQQARRAQENFSIDSEWLTLSISQQRFAKLHASNEFGAKACNIAFALEGNFDSKTLRLAWANLLNRLPSLRCEYQIRLFAQRHAVTTSGNPEIRVCGAESEWATLVQEEAETEFNISKQCAVRATIYAPAGALKQRLLIGFHHLAADGLGAALFLVELAREYEACAAAAKKTPLLATPPVSSIDTSPGFSLTKSTVLNEAPAPDFLHIIKTQVSISDVAPYLEAKQVLSLKWFHRMVAWHLPDWTALPQPGPNAYLAAPAEGSRHFDFVEESLLKKLRERSKELRITLFMLTLGAWNLTASRKMQSTTLSHAVPLSARTFKGSERVVGNFVNLFPVTLHRGKYVTYIEYFQHVKEQTALAFQLMDCPFETLVGHLVELGRCSPAEKLTSTFNLEPAGKLPKFGDTELTLLPTQAHGVELPFMLNITDKGSSLHVDCDYQLQFFSARQVAQILATFKETLEEVATAPPSQRLLFA